MLRQIFYLHAKLLPQWAFLKSKEQSTDLYGQESRQRRIPKLLRNEEPLQSSSSASSQLHSAKALRLPIRKALHSDSTVRSHVVTCSPFESDIITSAVHQTWS
ncbi:hypothetical protein sscle_09g070910 [Sclerotinia sclerotiorum 1980 UF-70]|nr:hypothetical protein sscle_09g070910 [Sclerotinia sclerotiorum 1980 UF-70]